MKHEEMIGELAAELMDKMYLNEALDVLFGLLCEDLDRVMTPHEVKVEYEAMTKQSKMRMN